LKLTPECRENCKDLSDLRSWLASLKLNDKAQAHTACGRQLVLAQAGALAFIAHNPSDGCNI
jgi:hypothetical protein